MCRRSIQCRRNLGPLVRHFPNRIDDVWNVRIRSIAYMLRLDRLIAFRELRTASALFLKADPASAVLLLALDDRVAAALWACTGRFAISILRLPGVSRPIAFSHAIITTHQPALDFVVEEHLAAVAFTGPIQILLDNLERWHESEQVIQLVRSWL